MKFKWTYNNKKYPPHKIRAKIKKVIINQINFRIKKVNMLIKNKFKANRQNYKIIQFLIN
jgi:hypothetical protein